MNIVDHFTYGTYEIQKNARETITRLGYKYGHLALLRNDFMCPHCEELHEAWSVANLVSGAYSFPGPIFRNIDDGCGYIYAITPLLPWDTATTQQVAKVAMQLIKLCIEHNGIPVTALGILSGDLNLKEGIPPGTVAGLNGYTKQ